MTISVRVTVLVNPVAEAIVPSNFNEIQIAPQI